MPFSDSVLYIMESQLEEAGTLVLNKIDLLDDAAVKELLAFSEERLPGRPVLAQNSLDQRHVLRWIEMIDSGGAQAPRFPARVDYDRYGEGETQLAWVDRALSAEDLGIGGRMQVIAMVREIAQALAEHRVPVAHVKFHVSCPGASAKISLTTLSQTGWESEIPDVAGAVELLVNARVQAESERAGDWIDAALERACVQSGGGWRVVTADTLTPQAPRRPY